MPLRLPHRPNRLSVDSLGIVAALALCALIYLPGLSGDFIFDDWSNILRNERLQVDHFNFEAVWQAALSADSGPLKRPVSMLSFWANYYTTGLHPFFFKLTNLLIHLGNGLALFVLAHLLLKAPVLRRTSAVEPVTVALIAVTIWLVHPLNLTGVLYVVQRMTSLSAAFVILALLCYAIGRHRLIEGKRGFPLIIGGGFVFGTLAVLSKENGALLLLYIAVIECTLFRFEAHDERTRRKLQALTIATVSLPALTFVFLATQQEWLANQYAVRGFTLSERLMSEARVLWLYAAWAALPTPGALGLFHDDVAISRGLLSPATTAVAILALAALVAGAAVAWKRVPLFSFAVLWFLAGHTLESSFIGLELVFEHRNYLPLFGVILAVVAGLQAALRGISLPVRVGLASAIILCFSSVTVLRAIDWGDPYRLRMSLVQHHPNSSRANYEAARALGDAALRDTSLRPALYDQTREYFIRSTELDEHSWNGLFSLILLDASVGKGTDPHVLERLRIRLQTVPLRFTIVDSFRSFLDWLLKGEVVLSHDDVLALFEAALDNQTSGVTTRATLLSILSAYHFSVAHDAQEAVSLAIAAVELEPEQPAHQISLADLAIKLGNLELGATALKSAREKDPLGQFERQIRLMEESIAFSTPTGS